MAKKKMGKRLHDPMKTTQSNNTEVKDEEVILPDAILVPSPPTVIDKGKRVEEELKNRKPLTAAEIAAMPYKDRPPRNEWPVDDVPANPKPYKKRRNAEGRTYGSGIGHIDFVSIFGFLILWAVCAGVEYYIMASMGLLQATAIALGIIFGLITAGVIVAITKGGGSFGGSDVGTWF